MLETNCRECQRERVMFSFTPLSTLKTESCFFNVAHASQEGGVGEAALTRSFALRPFCLKKKSSHNLPESVTTFCISIRIKIITKPQQA